MTKPLYINDTYLFESEASVLSCEEDEKGLFLVLDQTIFYPQGGGQPSDQGLIINKHFKANVILVRQAGNEIHHYIDQLSGEVLINSKVNCLVDSDRRLLNSRYHTAGHLIGNIVETIYPILKAVKGHSFSGEAYVEFQGNSTVDVLRIQNAMNEAIIKDDKTRIFETDLASFEREFYKLPYSIPSNKKFRVMQIGSMLPVPCGGTHLSSVSAIGQIVIGKVKIKNNMVRILYRIT